MTENSSIEMANFHLDPKVEEAKKVDLGREMVRRLSEEYKTGALAKHSEAVIAEYAQLLHDHEGLSTESAKSVAEAAVTERLTEDAHALVAVMDYVLDQYKYRKEHVEQAQLFLAGIKDFEFLSIGAYVGRIENDLTKIVQNLEQLERAKQGLQSAGDLASKRKEVLDAQVNAANWMEVIRQASQDMEDVHKEIPALITSAALDAYFTKNKTSEMERVEKINAAAKFAVGFGGGFAPPGLGWIPGLVNFLRDAADRAAVAKYLADAKEKYSEDNLVDSVFAEFDSDPLMMAKFLNVRIKANVETAMLAIGIAGETIPGWTFISAGIQSCVSAWLDRRIEVMKERISSAASSSKPLKEAMGEALTEFAKDAKESLRDALMEGELLGNAADQFRMMEYKPEFGQDLIAIAFQPIADLVVKWLPVTPAQLVTGDDLAGGVKGADLAQMIPSLYQVLSDPDKSDGARPQVQKLFPHAGDVVDSDQRASTEDEQYVAFSILDTKVWGRLRKPENGKNAVWQAVMPDYGEGAANWNGRRITKDGYTEGMSEVKGGRWVRPKGTSEHYYLYIHQSGEKGEWLRGITRTQLGRADEIFKNMHLEEHVLEPK
ncbi:hypothetical protein V1460_04480 [Streptomyces sp. SCSIO 30461]|uniref:hypothetical protein n=1 Tax=Streptomyces sp. SCSIO 30461 TaxID=3118085 RepID=UPI0030D0CBC3